MSDPIKISVKIIPVTQVSVQSFSGVSQIDIKNTNGDLIATATESEYEIENTLITVQNQNNTLIDSQEYVFGIDKSINVLNLNDSMIHIGLTPPEDTTKLWIDIN